MRVDDDGSGLTSEGAARERRRAGAGVERVGVVGARPREDVQLVGPRHRRGVPRLRLGLGGSALQPCDCIRADWLRTRLRKRPF